MFQPIFTQRFITRKNFLPHLSKYTILLSVKNTPESRLLNSTTFSTFYLSPDGKWLKTLDAVKIFISAIIATFLDREIIKSSTESVQLPSPSSQTQPHFQPFIWAQMETIQNPVCNQYSSNVLSPGRTSCHTCRSTQSCSWSGTLLSLGRTSCHTGRTASASESGKEKSLPYGLSPGITSCHVSWNMQSCSWSENTPESRNDKSSSTLLEMNSVRSSQVQEWENLFYPVGDDFCLLVDSLARWPAVVLFSER